jgi:hypothetical protein
MRMTNYKKRYQKRRIESVCQPPPMPEWFKKEYLEAGIIVHDECIDSRYHRMKSHLYRMTDAADGHELTEFEAQERLDRERWFRRLIRSSW